MTRNRGFSSIRTYDELEASLQMVKRQIRESQVTRQVHGLVSGTRPVFGWTNMTLLVLRMIKRRLSR